MTAPPDFPNRILLPAESVYQSVRFYTEACGLVLIRQRGTASALLRSRNGDLFVELRAAADSRQQSQISIALASSVELHLHVKALEELGIHARGPSVHDHLRAIHFSDPDGHACNFLEARKDH